MANKFANFSNALKDTKTRIVLFLVLAIVFIAIAIGLWRIFKPEEAPVAEVGLQTVPKLRSTPGVGEPTREYRKIQQQADIEYAQEALKTGGSALPTLSDVGYVNDEQVGPSTEEADTSGCSSEELQRARAAGVKVEELRCKGCSPESLKSAGYSAGELMDAGYTAKELKAADFNATALKDAGFDGKELLNANFTPADLLTAGFTNAQLAAPTVKTGSKTGDCSLDSLRKAKAAGADVSVLVKKGCDLSNLRQAGFTAAELKAAGLSAKDLAAAGFSAAELKDAGFTAAELKAAGFSAKQLKDAGFTAAELKDAGFSAGELRRAGFTAAELKDAGFSAADLRAAGFSAAELKDAGFSADELRGAGFSEGELTRAGFPPKQAEVATAATLTPLSTTDASTEAEAAPATLPAIPSSAPESDTLAQLRQYQAAELSRQQQEELAQQMQLAMATQAQDLLKSWGSTEGIDLKEFPKASAETTAGKQGGMQVNLVSGNQSAQAAPAASSAPAPIIKAGAVTFAVLQTSLNSDEDTPVLAQIVDGKLKGTKLVGKFKRVDKRIVLEFNTANIPDSSTSISINAVAIDPSTARSALATDVENHYLLRYGTLFASAFLTGLGNAISQSNTTTTNTLFGSITTRPEYSISQQALLALGQVGTRYGQVMSNNFTTPPTVHVASGTGIGVLFMQDVSLASENSPTPPNANLGAPAAGSASTAQPSAQAPTPTQIPENTGIDTGFGPTPMQALISQQQQQRQLQQSGAQQ